VRLLESNDKATIHSVIIDKIPGGRIHNGGRIKIGPDRKLYITTGDAGIAALAQDLDSLAGKILRLELDGRVPADNPFPNSLIFSLGHRNPQGLAWDSNQVLYSSEHGQSAHDEINIILPGANYGWPMVQGDNEVRENTTIKPLIHSNTITWAPSGITFIQQGLWKDRLLVACLRGEQLISITLNNNGSEVENLEMWLVNIFGRLREVIQAEDGSVYLTTSNRDGRGNPEPTDDRIIRLSPKNTYR
jgi:glucose/arabinose dehydrogenase